jgi:glucosamine--fructose-6-phosphate aminotransferase (isomerizing)
LKVAESLRSRQIPSLGITCATGQQLERLATATICLAPADERSTVMTRSFTSMLLGITDLAARMRGNGSLLNQLRELPRAVASVLNTLPKRVREFVDEYRFDDYVCLGQGPLYGIACESALKLTEMSVSYGQSFHTLEFRHGPKSIVSPRTLILFLLSERGYESECEVLEEVKQLGGTTMVVANHVEPHARASADFLLELGLNVPEIARLVAYLCAAQLMGLYTGLKKGLDPDHPRNLSRVVLLEESNPETHAAI